MKISFVLPTTFHWLHHGPPLPLSPFAKSLQLQQLRQERLVVGPRQVEVEAEAKVVLLVVAVMRGGGGGGEEQGFPGENRF